MGQEGKKVINDFYKCCIILLFFFWLARPVHELGHYLIASLNDCNPQFNFINWINPIEDPFVMVYCSDNYGKIVTSYFGLLFALIILIPFFKLNQLKRLRMPTLLGLVLGARKDFEYINLELFKINIWLFVISSVFYYSLLSIAGYKSLMWYLKKIIWGLNEQKKKKSSLN